MPQSVRMPVSGDLLSPGGPEEPRPIDAPRRPAAGSPAGSAIAKSNMKPAAIKIRKRTVRHVLMLWI